MYFRAAIILCTALSATTGIFAHSKAGASTIVQPPFEAHVDAIADSVFQPGASQTKVGVPTIIASATWDAAFAEARVAPLNSLHSFATATSSGHAGADALFTDQLFIYDANGLPITSANVVISARVDGTLSATGDGVASVDALLDPFSGSNTGQPAEFALDVPDGLAGHYIQDLVASYSGDVTRGLSFNFSILVNTIVDGIGSATADFGNTGVVTGIQINDLDGNPIPGAYYASASGVVYGVPEPHALALVATAALGALLSMSFYRRRRLRLAD